MSAAPAEDEGIPEGGERSTSEGPAWVGLRTLALRFGLVAVLLALDLWSKAAVFAWLRPLEGTGELSRGTGSGHERMLVLGEDHTWFSFMLSTNRGAAFGRFSDWPWLLVSGRILAVLFLIWLVARTPAKRRWFGLALVLVLAGALGNLYDNLFLEPFEGDTFGQVRDFIDVYFEVWNWHFPTFNVADSCITVGAILLLITGFRRDPEEEPPAPADSAPSA